MLLCAGLKSMLLEKRVSVLSEALDMKDAQLGEVLAAAHLDPATLQQVRVAAWVVSVALRSMSCVRTQRMPLLVGSRVHGSGILIEPQGDVC